MALHDVEFGEEALYPVATVPAEQPGGDHNRAEGQENDFEWLRIDTNPAAGIRKYPVVRSGYVSAQHYPHKGGD